MRRLPLAASRAAVHASLPPKPPGFGANGRANLVDARGRTYDYVRISIADRCDLACIYCMPPSGEAEHGLRSELLSFEEIARIASVLAASGVRRLRLTGGEPLARKDVVRLVEAVSRQTPIEDIVLTTNATRLAELARPLADAGLTGVNVSIDSLDASRFRRITRGGDLTSVLAGIRAALDAGLEVKLNTVVIGGENDDELDAIVDYAWALGVTPRFIELMPIGEGAKLGAGALVPLATIVERLGHRLATGSGARDAGHGPARYIPSTSGQHRVGFITAVTGNFCDDCNRIRLTAKGDVRACLASRRAISVRDVMRAGGSDEDVLWAFHWALSTKEAGHAFFDEAVVEHTHVGMSLIGG